MDAIWACKSLKFDDLPTLGELIGEADEKILAREVAGEFARDAFEPMTPEQVKGLTKRVRKTIREMKSIEPKKPSRKWVFLSVDAFDVDYGSAQKIKVETGTQLISRKEVMAAGAGELEGPLVGRAIEFTPWRKTLSYRIWFDEGQSRRERYLALANIVVDMTFFGATAERAERRAMKAMRKLERIDADTKSGKERFVPAELVFRGLGLESSTDDYDSEYEEHLHSIVRALNEQARKQFEERAADLGRRLAR